MDSDSSSPTRESPPLVEEGDMLNTAQSYSLFDWIELAKQSDQVVTRAVHYKHRLHWYQHDYVLITVESPSNQPSETPVTVMITRDIHGPNFFSCLSLCGQTKVRFSVIAEGEEGIIHDHATLVGEPLSWPRDKAPPLREVTLCIFRITLFTPVRLILPNHCRSFTSHILPAIRGIFKSDGVFHYPKGPRDFCLLIGVRVSDCPSVHQVVSNISLWVQSGNMLGISELERHWSTMREELRGNSDNESG